MSSSRVRRASPDFAPTAIDLMDAKGGLSGHEDVRPGSRGYDASVHSDTGFIDRHGDLTLLDQRLRVHPYAEAVGRKNLSACRTGQVREFPGQFDLGSPVPRFTPTIFFVGKRAGK